MSLRIAALVLLVVAGTFAGKEPSLEEALEQALNADSVDIQEVRSEVKREVKGDTGDLESLLDGHPKLHVVKRAAQDEFVAYGDSLEDAKANALKMAQEMFGAGKEVRFR